MRILQDLVLVCGVLPLVEWLEGFSTMGPVSSKPVVGPHGSPRDVLRYCYIPVDFTCSLLAELGSDLGVVALRESPNARGDGMPNSGVREGQTHLVVSSIYA